MNNQVLHIEDDSEWREAILLTLLDKTSLEIDSAENIKEAIEKIKYNNYKVIITDLDLGAWGPEDGLRIIEKIKIISPLTKIIIISGYDKFVKQKLPFGVRSFISKSNFHISDLNEEINSCIIEYSNEIDSLLRESMEAPTLKSKNLLSKYLFQEQTNLKRNNPKDKLKDLFAKGQIKEVLDFLVKSDKITTDLKNHILVCSAKYHILEKEVNGGKIGSTEKNVELSNIYYSIVQIIDQLPYQE